MIAPEQVRASAVQMADAVGYAVGYAVGITFACNPNISNQRGEL